MLLPASASGLLRSTSSVVAPAPDSHDEAAPINQELSSQGLIGEPLAWAAMQSGPGGLSTLRTLSGAASLLQAVADGRLPLKVPAGCHISC